MLKAVIFDMDGVLLNSEPLYFEAEKRLMQQLGISITDKEHESFVGAPSKNLWEYCKEKYDLKQSVEELDKRENQIYIELFEAQKNITTLPGVVELMNDLKNNNIKLALASSSIRKVIDMVVEHFDFKAMFTKLISGEDVSKGKPHPDIFLLTAQKVGVLPEECLVIEDSRNGVMAAKAAGMKCIGYSNPTSGNQDLSMADYVTTDFSELNYKFLTKFFRES